MRRAGLVLGAPVLLWALAAPAFSQEGASFTLAAVRDPWTAPALTARAGLLEPEALAPMELGPELDLPSLDVKPAAPVVSVSVFLGRGDGDLFASLHKDYAWRMTFKSMTLGLGIFREIPLAKGIGIQPYLGVIRSSATLRPSDRFGGRGAFEYRLTVLSVGLPLVLRFN
jgi:hypothetical protein